MDIRGQIFKPLLCMALGLLALSTAGCSYLESHGMRSSTAHPVSYREKGGKIDLDSVCVEQSEDEGDFHRCATEADEWFEHQCNSYRGLYQSSDPGTSERYRHEYHKFCDAAAAWETPERD